MKLIIQIAFLFIAINTVSLYSESIRRISHLPVPDGFQRLQYKKTSFSRWIQNLPLKSSNRIQAYNGKFILSDYYNILAVVRMELLFQSDLEQCADYCMRFWAEYHRDSNRLYRLYLFNYHGNKIYYNKTRRTFKSFLRRAMGYSNSHSLKKGCRKIRESQIIPGDMIVQNKHGGIGHVSMIMDVCMNHRGIKLYLIGFSFMPAQEFHLEKAHGRYGITGWFTLEGYFRFLSKYYNYGKPVIRRF